MPFRRTALILALSLAPLSAAANFPVDPGVAAPAVTRLSATSARVAWTTAIPAAGGVLQYSKKHQFALGLDPFTLRVVQEAGAPARTHEILVSDLDGADDWRFMVSYQPAAEFKYDSPLVHPFAAGTGEAAAGGPRAPAAPPAPDPAPAGR